MLLLYGDFFLQQEIRNAAIQCGYEPVLLDYRNFSETQQYQSELQKQIQRTKPEFILSINMLGFDGNGVLSELSWKFGIPVIIWFVDDPRPILLHQKQFIKPSFKAFCWERSFLTALKECGFRTVEFLPLATDPDLFSLSEQKRKYCDIGFVGSSMGSDFLSSISKKFMWNNELHAIVQQCAEIFLKSPIKRVEDILHDVCKELKIPSPFSDTRNSIWFISYIIHTASMLKRQRTISALMELGIQTFGDPCGWKQLCGNQLPVNPNIDYRSKLSEIYRGIEININITSCQMATAVNQRVFDVPVCGGFIINDLQDDLNHLFNPNHLVTYESIDDL